MAFSHLFSLTFVLFNYTECTHGKTDVDVDKKWGGWKSTAWRKGAGSIRESGGISNCNTEEN